MNMHRVLKGDFRIGYYSGIGYPQNVGLHTHPYHELSLVSEGDITYCSGNCTEHVVGKSIIFSAAYELHQPYVRSDAAYENYQIMFRDELLSSGLPEARGLLSRVFAGSFIAAVSDSEHDRMLAVMRILYDRYGSEPTSERALLEYKLLVTELMLMALDVVSRSAAEKVAQSTYIDGVIGYIKEHYAEELRLDALSAAFFVSYAKLTRDFKRKVGMTVQRYVTLTRLENAKLLLKQGYSVCAVASRCGFSSPSYFIKIFRRYTHETPLRFQWDRLAESEP